MTDDQRRAIAEARATVERVSRLSSRNDTPREDIPNRLEQWREGVRQQEAEFARSRAERQSAENDERSKTEEWMRWVSARIDAGVLHCTRELATALRDELDVRDAAISKMHAAMHRMEAEHQKLLARVIKGEIDKDDHAKAAIDLPNPLVRRH
jgi:hypothetical protein